MDAELSKKAGYRHLPPERQGRPGLQGKNVPAHQHKVGHLSGSGLRQGLLTDPLWSFYPDLPVTSRHPSPHQLSVLLAMAHTQYLLARLHGAQMQDQSPPLQRPTGQYSKLHLRRKWGHHGTLAHNHLPLGYRMPTSLLRRQALLPLPINPFPGSPHAHAGFGQSIRSGNLPM